MPLRSPNLDDRTFEQLLEEAKLRAKTLAPGWEFSPSDPGVILLELFAHLTEILIYRLNRVPEKAYIEFLGLLGLRIQPPSAASVELVFRLAREPSNAVEIPKGTRVTVARAAAGEEPPVFVTAHATRIEPGSTQATARAYNAELIEGELVGRGTGLPRLSVATRRAPIVSATDEDLAMIVGIEADPKSISERVPSLSYDGKVYRVWTEAENFTNLPPDATVFTVDRISGIITFAPAIRLKVREDGGSGTPSSGATAPEELSPVPQALGAVPDRGREIRVWYWRGGGTAGNVAPDTLTTLKDPLPGVSVTNPDRASGGRAAETLENALLRGPEEFRSLERAVTASDYEILARRNGAVARVKAVTLAQLWAHAAAGTVQVLLVPEVPESELSGPLDAAKVGSYESENAREPVVRVLEERKPLGTTCLVTWARYKTVSVSARIVAFRAEDAEALQARVLTRLYRRINPTEWPFGRALRASDIYDIVLREPGVSYMEPPSFVVDAVPGGEVPCIIRDYFQPRTWHAVSGDSVYRTINDGEGWERTASFTGQKANTIAASPARPGLLAAATSTPGTDQDSRIYISTDDGETWLEPRPMALQVHSMAWMMRDNVPVLLIASSVGLYEIAMEGGRDPVQVLVDPKNANGGFNAVATITDVRGGVAVAVATVDNSGVYISFEGGRPETFKNVGLDKEDVRVLVPQYDGPRAYLWAGFAATGGAVGTGAARVEVLGSALSADSWQRYSKDWRGGSCWSLAFHGLTAYAASYQAGVLRLDTSAKEPAWVAPDIGVGLPQRGVERIFQWIKTVAASPSSGVILCGSTAGVYRSTDGGQHYQESSRASYPDNVTLPETWLLCSGEHKIEVIEGGE